MIKLRKKTNIFLLVVSGCVNILFISLFFPFELPWSLYFNVNTANVVGVTASIPSNPHNTLLAQLKEKENELNEREKDLAEKESIILASTEVNSSKNNRVIFGAFAISLVVFVLVGLNFYFDWKRSKTKT